jgi:hypothetical protein
MTWQDFEQQMILMKALRSFGFAVGMTKTEIHKAMLALGLPKLK